MDLGGPRDVLPGRGTRKLARALTSKPTTSSFVTSSRTLYGPGQYKNAPAGYRLLITVEGAGSDGA